jgi:hypothetical protein
MQVICIFATPKPPPANSNNKRELSLCVLGGEMETRSLADDGAMVTQHIKITLWLNTMRMQTMPEMNYHHYDSSACLQRERGWIHSLVSEICSAEMMMIPCEMARAARPPDIRNHFFPFAPHFSPKFWTSATCVYLWILLFWHFTVEIFFPVWNVNFSQGNSWNCSDFKDFLLFQNLDY